MTALLVPALLVCIGLWSLHQRTDLYAVMTKGAKKGLETVYSILPPLIVLLTAISMLRASGFLDLLAALCTPVMKLLGIPVETAPLMFLRPFSGSGALAVGSELMQQYGPDSSIGRTAAVMLGSTETTFYVVGVYFGALGIKKTRHAVPAALAADLVGFIAAAFTVRLFFA